MIFKTALPIDNLKVEIIESLKSHSNLILKASPGSGKTTRVPLYLLENARKKIYILEPRRLAAKLAAQQVASALGETVGQRVGYIFRYEKKVSDQTQIYFLTEGTFLKIFSKNKNLNDVEIVILDEFHERHLTTDASLSFLTRLQHESRPDLKILIMSATIETNPLENFLKSFAPSTTLELNLHRFPLKINYLPNVTTIIQTPLHKKVYEAVLEVLDKNLSGDILIFLPGMREIRDCQNILINLCEENEMLLLILHGDLDTISQDKVFLPSKNRKIILSTNIAESSVTISGISIVIDSGLSKESSYNFYSGLPELNTTQISQASATQRSGRANRQGPGMCYRLYAELNFMQRPLFQKPEISKSDLSELFLVALELFDLHLDRLTWFEAPPSIAINNSLNLLLAINAIDKDHLITKDGKNILHYPLHPRLARILVEAEKYSNELHREAVNFIINFLGEKNKDRLINSLTPKRIIANQIPKHLEEIILSGFPDRVARTRGSKYYDVITQNGETIKISPEISNQFDPTHQLWIVIDINYKGDAIKCIPIEEEWLYNITPFPISEISQYSWDEKNDQIIKVEKIMLGKILLSESKSKAINANDETKQILINIIKPYLQSLLATQEYERLLTLNKVLNHSVLTFNDEVILKNYLEDQLHFNDNDKKNFSYYFFDTLKNTIDPNGIYTLESDFPLSIQLTDKRKIPITYDHTQDPSIESFIQDFYGLVQTPLIAKGKIPLTLKLIGPHKRAIQVTQDLASFWKNTYPQMLKELTRDYPRHHWPLKPESAPPILLKRQLPTV